MLKTNYMNDKLVKIEEVFKLSGVPYITFVEPKEYLDLIVALGTPGRGIVIEGPSGIGKTTAVTRCLMTCAEDAMIKLSARKEEDREEPLEPAASQGDRPRRDRRFPEEGRMTTSTAAPSPTASRPSPTRRPPAPSSSSWGSTASVSR